MRIHIHVNVYMYIYIHIYMHVYIHSPSDHRSDRGCYTHAPYTHVHNEQRPRKRVGN